MAVLWWWLLLWECSTWLIKIIPIITIIRIIIITSSTVTKLRNLTPTQITNIISINSRLNNNINIIKLNNFLLFIRALI
jgi:hypothetical protein